MILATLKEAGHFKDVVFDRSKINQLNACS